LAAKDTYFKPFDNISYHYVIGEDNVFIAAGTVVTVEETLEQINDEPAAELCARSSTFLYHHYYQV